MVLQHSVSGTDLLEVEDSGLVIHSIVGGDGLYKVLAHTCQGLPVLYAAAQLAKAHLILIGHFVDVLLQVLGSGYDEAGMARHIALRAVVDHLYLAEAIVRQLACIIEDEELVRCGEELLHDGVHTLVECPLYAQAHAAQDGVKELLAGHIDIAEHIVAEGVLLAVVLQAGGLAFVGLGAEGDELIVLLGVLAHLLYGAEVLCLLHGPFAAHVEAYEACYGPPELVGIAWVFVIE